MGKTRSGRTKRENKREKGIKGLKSICAWRSGGELGREKGHKVYCSERMERKNTGQERACKTQREVSIKTESKGVIPESLVEEKQLARERDLSEQRWKDVGWARENCVFSFL